MLRVFDEILVGMWLANSDEMRENAKKLRIQSASHIHYHQHRPLNTRQLKTNGSPPKITPQKQAISIEKIQETIHTIRITTQQITHHQPRPITSQTIISPTKFCRNP
eukprot:388719_1